MGCYVDASISLFSASTAQQAGINTEVYVYELSVCHIHVHDGYVVVQEISVTSTAVTTLVSCVAGHLLRQYIDVRED